MVHLMPSWAPFAVYEMQSESCCQEASGCVLHLMVCRPQLAPQAMWAASHTGNLPADQRDGPSAGRMALNQTNQLHLSYPQEHIILSPFFAAVAGLVTLD